ncbi:uncharacterized protein pbxip1a [Clarias gariepinus]|uniref:cell cycle progression protein 1 n=1 Tax=Clarias gariepinus TaxID=13013 RepID=UPI00234D69B6|nr:cell cycle progression protein 1 [Clarias gariepinus]
MLRAGDELAAGCWASRTPAMSDNSTGSSGSSTNSWTLLSPEEADIAGAGDDGTESIGDVPSLSEELAGSCLEMKPSDHEAPPETVLSEEGHQVCQETSPELFDEGAVSGPSVEADPEICAPVIHATITTSPPDNDLLGAVPFSISTESSVFLSQEPFLETSYEESLFNLQPVFDFSPKEYVVAETAPEHVDKDAPVSEPIAEIGPVSEPLHDFPPASEPVHEIAPASKPKAELSPAKEPKAEIAPPSEPVTEIGRVSKPVDEIGPASEHKAETTPALEHKAETTPALEHKAETTPALEHKAETTPALEHKAETTPASEHKAQIAPSLEHVAEIGHVSKFVEEITPASEPKAKTTPASEPKAEITPASEPKAETTPASEPKAEITPASEPKAETTPASEPKAETTPASDPKAETTPASEPVNEIRPASEHKAKIVPASEPVVEISPIAGPPDITLGSESSRTSAVPVSDIETGVSSCPESSSPSLSSPINFSSAAEGPYPKTPASSVLEKKELVSDTEEQKSVFVSREAESLGTDVLIESRGQGSGLRQRRVHYSEELRQSTDEEDEEEFQLPDRKEERPGFAISYLIIGALALLCLGSLFFSGSVLDQAGDDFDGSELSDQELLEKLVEENKQISILEKQIQVGTAITCCVTEQRDELDRALRAAAEKPISEEEHARMKEELSALPSLKEELEALKARISELTQLTGNQLSEPSPGPDRRRGRQDELTRQMTLLEQSRTRLEGMKKQNQPKKWLRERLVEMQQRLSEQVDHIGRKDEWRRKHKGGEARKNEMGDSVQKRKELLKKYRYDWEHKKSERKLERETRKQERSWQARPGHKHKHDHKVQHESKDFWKLQEKKLRSNRNPPEHCHDVSSCAEVQGLIRVKLSDFQDLLDVYLNKLQGLTEEHKQAFHHLVAQSFHGGVFSHDRSLFSEFVEDVADILEDLVDVLMDDDELEKEMEEFEREALLKFAA